MTFIHEWGWGAVKERGAMSILLNILTKIDDVLYYPILIIIMAVAGLIFTLRTKFVQVRLFGEACHLIMEKPADKQHVSSFQALMVSTASRVGTGNIVGVSTAICLGGPGSVFWMWVMCIIGAASAFVESTLAQIYKRKDKDGGCYGGPAYYIEQALRAPWLSILFCICLIATYAVGFNLLCSYNLQSTFAAYGFYDAKTTPIIVGAVLAVLVGYCVLGGGKKVVRLTEVVVPFMGIFYVAIALIVILAHLPNIPGMFVMIFRDAFDFRAIFGGISGSCMIYGIKRGLYSNEAGVGSAPNASASADVSHPVKQGLVQTVSVYIDTMLLCTATALMCLSSGVEISVEVNGTPYVQNALATVFGALGPVFITLAMILFAFTTLLGNLYYVDNALIYMNGKKKPRDMFMRLFYIACSVIIFLGAVIPMDAAWAAADITMGLMTIINLPCCFILFRTVKAALDDYEKQKKAGKNPEFHAADIGMDTSRLSFWK